MRGEGKNEKQSIGRILSAGETRTSEGERTAPEKVREIGGSSFTCYKAKQEH